MYSRCNNFLNFPESLWYPHILFYITCNLSGDGDTQLGLLSRSDNDLLKARNADTVLHMGT